MRWSKSYGGRQCACLAAVLPLLLVWMASAYADDSGLKVNVLSMMYHKDYMDSEVNGVNAGFDASLSAHGWKTGSGATVSVIRPPSYNTTPHDMLQQGLQQSDGKLLIVLGPMGTDNLLQSRDALQEHDLVGIAPVAYSSEVRGWDTHLYFTSVEPNAELLALIRYVVAYLHLPRVGMMFVKGSSFGKQSYEFAVRVLSMMGRELCGVFSAAVNDSDNLSEDVLCAEWDRFVATRPQAVLLFSSLVDSTSAWFIKKVAQDSRTSQMFLLTPSDTRAVLVQQWKDALLATGGVFVPGQLITTGVVPLANDNRSSMVRHFQRDMDEYLEKNSDWSGFAKPEHYLKDDNAGEMMVFGWLAGEVLLAALDNAPQLSNRTSFRESLYKQRRYVIDDVVIGDFGKECEEDAVLQGAICECNQGGSMVYMKEVVDGFRLSPLDNGALTWGVSECTSANVEVRAPLIGLFVLLMNDAITLRAATRWFMGADALGGVADGRVNRISRDDRLFFQSLAVTSANLTQSIQEVRDTKDVSAMFGVVPVALLDAPNMLFISPMVVGIRRNNFRRNVIHLLPVLAQQLYVLAVYLSNTSSKGARALVNSHQADEINDLLYKSLVTFGVPFNSSTILGDSDSVAPYLSGSGDTFVIGLNPPDVTAIVDYLGRNQRARVLVAFNDVALLYDEFIAAFNASERSIACSERLLLATSLPHWAERNSISETVAGFHQAVVDETYWNPLTFMGFAAARMLQTILPHMRKVSAELLADYIYAESNIKVDDMRYGPFSDAECIGEASKSATRCELNFGATNLSVWSMARVLSASVPVLQGGITPSMEYVIPDGGSLTRSQIAGVVVGCVAMALLFGALGVVLHLTLRNARDNNRAPREPTDPVTLVFSDIESSTAQWAAFPELMPDAVAAHHRLIRTLIADYGCYEVKTVGDSFMIASKSPFAAVQLARDLQQCFLHLDWGTAAFDEFYRQFEEQRAEGDSEYTPPTARLDPDVYGRLWSGLRVRVGIHTGLCDIRHDEVTKGYDYYGRTPNMAARTESVANGGQVLLTHAAYMSLSAEERECVDVTALGPVALRGVGDPVEMWRLNAVPGRTFAALRLDREYFFDDGEDGTTTSTSDHSSTRAELSESAQTIAIALHSLLSTFKAPQREKLLLPYCERWRVPLPRKAVSAWDDDYCEEVVRRIAVKVGRVTERCDHSESDTSSRTQSSSSIIIVPFYDSRCHERCSLHPSVSDQ